MQDGDLDKYVRAPGGQLLPEDTIMLKFVQICLAVHYIHSKVSLHIMCSCHFPFHNLHCCSFGLQSLPALLNALDLSAVQHRLT